MTRASQERGKPQRREICGDVKYKQGYVVKIQTTALGFRLLVEPIRLHRE